MSAEIQPKKIRLAEISAVFFPSQPNFSKQCGLGVYYQATHVCLDCTLQPYSSEIMGNQTIRHPRTMLVLTQD